MADIIDQAAEYSEREKAHLIAKARAWIRNNTERLSECEDCGEKIPEARRKAAPGCSRCLDCQEAFERKME